MEIAINSNLSDHNTIISEVDFDGISNCDTVILEYDLKGGTEEQWEKAKAWIEAKDFDDIDNGKLLA